MGIIDSHIHKMPGKCDSPQAFMEKTAEAGVTEGTILSLPPLSSYPYDKAPSAKQRIDDILEYTSSTPGFIPFFWMDPTEPDAIQQLEDAKASGIRGIKVICSHFFPKDVLPVFQKIADIGMPLHFHSGILWDHNVSSDYNRPLAYECLMSVKGLCFALAHISWPWCDECIALYGKFDSLSRSPVGRHFQMFIDTTPGTPPLYRLDAFRKIYCTNYDVNNNVFFGTDNLANNYDVKWAKFWLEKDREALETVASEIEQYSVPGATGGFNAPDNGLRLSSDQLFNLYTSENYRKFLGC